MKILDKILREVGRNKKKSKTQQICKRYMPISH